MLLLVVGATRILLQSYKQTPPTFQNTENEDPAKTQDGI